MAPDRGDRSTCPGHGCSGARRDRAPRPARRSAAPCRGRRGRRRRGSRRHGGASRRGRPPPESLWATTSPRPCCSDHRRAVTGSCSWASTRTTPGSGVAGSTSAQDTSSSCPTPSPGWSAGSPTAWTYAAGRGALGVGTVVGVVGGRGGAGASTLSVALGLAAARRDAAVMLVEADPLGGGLDLMLGLEHAEGLRWPDLAASRGRVSTSSLVSAVAVASTVSGFCRGRATTSSTWLLTRCPSVLSAAARAHDLVVVDLPRLLDPAAQEAAARCSVVYLLVPAEVRAVSAAARVAVGVGWSHHAWRWSSAALRPAGCARRGDRRRPRPPARRLDAGRAAAGRDARARRPAGCEHGSPLAGSATGSSPTCSRPGGSDRAA